MTFTEAELGAIDIGGRDMAASRKYRNVAAARIGRVLDRLGASADLRREPWESGRGQVECGLNMNRSG